MYIISTLLMTLREGYSDATPLHCSTKQGKIALPLFSAALQIKLTAALCHCKYTFKQLVKQANSMLVQLQLHL